jgi:hypothetical protein
MTPFLRCAALLLLASSAAQAQTVLYSQDFEGAHDWTLNVATGTQGADANFWTDSANEGGVLPPGCQVANNGNKTLHVTEVFNPSGGAAYDAGGLCGFLFYPQANTRAESPAFSTLGATTVQLKFNYIANGDALNDNASVQFDAGAGWTDLTASIKSPLCGGGQGQWTTYTATLPAAAVNNSSVKIGIRWVNNDDGVGTDPSVAIDHVVITGITVPDAPTIGTATAGDALATVAFTGPANDGGDLIDHYTATSTPDSITANCNASPCTVMGLTNGTAYTFTVTATNGVGTGAPSGASNSVTPAAATPVGLQQFSVE